MHAERQLSIGSEVAWGAGFSQEVRDFLKPLAQLALVRVPVSRLLDRRSLSARGRAEGRAPQLQ